MTVWPTTTRAEIMARARQGFGSGLNRVWYSQDTFAGSYRADCSGFVCRVLGLTDDIGHGWWGGLNTVTLVTSGALYEIPFKDLKQGDLAGELGPGTGGDGGHVYVFDRWYNTDPDDDQMYIYEQCGGTQGPVHSLRTWPYPGTCRAYRYRGLTDDSTDQETDDMQIIETSLSATKRQVLPFGAHVTLNWNAENADPLHQHADSSSARPQGYPGFVPALNGYARGTAYLQITGTCETDKLQVRLAMHTWNTKTGKSTGVTYQVLHDLPCSDGDQYLTVSVERYATAGQHWYLDAMVTRAATDTDTRETPELVTAVWAPWQVKK